jgi:restriction system protein
MLSFEDQLHQKKTDLQKKISNLESQVRPLNANIAQLQRELSAIDVLLPSNGSRPDAGPKPARANVDVKDRFTPVEDFWVPILQTIVELGGSGRYEHVIDMVGKKMENVLTPADKEKLRSGIYVRWRNRVAWQRFNMVKEGLLRKDSPRGVWEVTPQGRAWLELLKEKRPPNGQ